MRKRRRLRVMDGGGEGSPPAAPALRLIPGLLPGPAPLPGPPAPKPPRPKDRLTVSIPAGTRRELRLAIKRADGLAYALAERDHYPGGRVHNVSAFVLRAVQREIKRLEDKAASRGYRAPDRDLTATH